MSEDLDPWNVVIVPNLTQEEIVQLEEAQRKWSEATRDWKWKRTMMELAGRDVMALKNKLCVAAMERIKASEA